MADLAKTLCKNCPKLFVVGKKGWLNAETVAYLERCPEIQPYVYEITDYVI